MDDSIWRMRVQPVDAPRRLRDTDVLRDRHRLAMVEDAEVLMDGDALPFLCIARDAVDGLRHGPDGGAGGGGSESARDAGGDAKNCHERGGREGRRWALRNV